MTLLRQIQDSAIDDSASVASLLRQCLLLAARLDSAELKAWAERELEGYGNEDELPPYRPPVECTVQGNLSGPFQSYMQNHTLARGSVPEKWRDVLFSVEIRQGAAELEAFAARGETSLRSPWPGDVVAATQDDHMHGMSLIQAWRVIPMPVILGVLDSIRTRVLLFAIDLERENPDAGEAAMGDHSIPDEQVTQIVVQNFYGDNATAANAGRDVLQSFDRTIVLLKSKLVELGVADSAATELVKAVEAEGLPGPDGPGEKTAAWLSRLETGAIAIGSGVTTQAAIEAINSLLGLS
jgi:hypothetical protein